MNNAEGFVRRRRVSHCEKLQSPKVPSVTAEDCRAPKESRLNSLSCFELPNTRKDKALAVVPRQIEAKLL